MNFEVFKSLVIKNSKVIIDGVEVSNTEDFLNSISINITINSNIGNIDVSQCNTIVVNGNVEGNTKTSQGDIEIKGNVSGDVKNSMGNIKCGNVSGNVKTSMGNVTHTKCNCQNNNNIDNNNIDNNNINIDNIKPLV